jgi:EmrB/QacA subfamily drug resistance transporter
MHDLRTERPTQGAADGWRRWATLPVVLAGTFMVVLDFFIVNVAIPSTQRELHAGSTSVQWIVAGYGLAMAAGLITSGRLGDLYGRRRVFAAGLVLFTLASAGCGLAPTPEVLVLSRVVQGMAAALLSPQVLSILGTIYAGRDRARAFTAYGMTMGLAAVSGQLIGGLLTRADLAGLGWRACFLINLPVGAAALLLAYRLVPRLRAERRTRLDLAGAAMVTLGLVAVVLPLIQGRAQGWPPWTWLCLAASAPLLAAFAGHQRWLAGRGRAPLIDLRLFGERAFTVGVLTHLVFYAGMGSFFLVLALYLQQGRGLDPLAAGLVFTAVGTGYLVTSLSAQPLARRLGRQALAVGGLVMAAGLAAAALTVQRLGLDGNLALLAPALLLDGLGMGMVTAPLTATVLAGVSPQHAGAASGVLTTAVQVGGAVGVAVIGVVFYGALGSGGPGLYPGAFAASLVYLVAVAVTVAALIQLLSRAGAAVRAEPAAKAA